MANPFDQFDSANPFDQFDTPEKPAERTAIDTVKDVGISALKSAISVPEAAVGLINIPTAGLAGKAVQSLGVDFKGAKSILDENLSDAQKAANQRVESADGFVDTAAAMLQNPSTIAHGTIESLGLMGAGGVIGRGVAAVAPKIAPWAAGAVGEGVIGAGSAAESFRQKTADGELTYGQAGSALASGFGTGVLGAIGGRIANKMGISDVDTMLVKGGANTTEKGVIRRILEGGISEGILEEMPQSAQEQVWQNAAFGRPLLEGVPEASAQGLVLGGVMGGGVNMLSPKRAAIEDIAAAPDIDSAISTFAEATSQITKDTANLNATIDAARAGVLLDDQKLLPAPPTQPDFVAGDGGVSIGSTPMADLTTDQVAALDNDAAQTELAPAEVQDERTMPIAREVNIPTPQVPPTGQEAMLASVRQIMANGGPRTDAERMQVKLAERELGTEAVTQQQLATTGRALMTRDQQKAADLAATPPISIAQNPTGTHTIKTQTPEQADAVRVALKEAGVKLTASDRAEIVIPKAAAQTGALSVAQNIVSRLNTKYSESRVDDDLLTLEGTTNGATTAQTQQTQVPSLQETAQPGTPLPASTRKTRQLNQIPLVSSKGLTRGKAAAMQAIGRLTGTRIEFFNDSKDGEGFYRGGNTVHINIARGDVTLRKVFGHEVTHQLKEQHKEAWEAMKEVVRTSMKADGLQSMFNDYFASYGDLKLRLAEAQKKGPEAVAQLMQMKGKDAGYRDREETIEEILMEEIVSDLGGNRFGETDFWLKVGEKVMAREGTERGKSILKKMFDALIKMIDGLRMLARDENFKADEFIQPEKLDAVRNAISDAYALMINEARTRPDVGAELDSSFDTVTSVERTGTEKESSHKVGEGDRAKREISKEIKAEAQKLIPKLVRYATKGVAGKDWYENSAKEVLKVFNGDMEMAEKFIRMIAITSPSTEVGANTTKAVKAWNQFANGEEFKVGTENTNRQLTDSLYFGKLWEGIKTNTFYVNLHEAMLGTDSGFSTQDMHMGRLAFDNEQPTEIQYHILEEATRRVAKKLGVLPRQAQAMIWVPEKAKHLMAIYKDRGWHKEKTTDEKYAHAFIQALADYGTYLVKNNITSLPVNQITKITDEARQQLTQTAFLEAVPSEKTPEGKAAAALDMKSKTNYTKAVFSAVPPDEVAKSVLGRDDVEIRVIGSTGGYQPEGSPTGKTSPNVMVQMVSRKGERISKEEAVQVAVALNYVYTQDGVPVARYDQNLNDDPDADDIVRFTLPAAASGEVTPAQEQKFYRLLESVYGVGIGYSKTAKTQITVGNYSGLTTQDFYAKAADVMSQAGVTAEFTAAEGEYVYHDWQKDPNADSHRARDLSDPTGRSDLQARLAGWRNDAVQASQSWLTENGVKFSEQRSDAAGSGFDGAVPEREVPGKGISATGVHYSKQKRDSLSSALFGTGLQGAELDRVKSSSDPRIKQRIYFYINGGRGINPEFGVGPHAHKAELSNLYDIDADPSDLGVGLGGDYNLLETRILDAGFDGYASPDRGIAIMLGYRNMPVEYIEGMNVKPTVPLAGKATPSTYQQQIRAVAANRSLPGGQMTGADWKRLMPALMPEIDVSHLDDETKYYKDGIVKKPETKMSEFRAVDTESPEFKKWFGDWQDPKAFSSRYPTDKTPVSHAVNDDNSPMRLYHATNNDFSEFQTGRDSITSTTFGDIETRRHAVFMTPDVNFAEEYLKKRDGGNVIPVYLNVKSPMDLRNNKAWDYVDELNENGFPGTRWPNLPDTQMWEMFDDETGEQFVAAAQKAGYDGAVMYEANAEDKMVEVWVAFSPTQIKSAISNTGEFSETNPDIRFSERRLSDLWESVASKDDAFRYKTTDKKPMLDVLNDLVPHMKADEVTRMYSDELKSGQRMYRLAVPGRDTNTGKTGIADAYVTTDIARREVHIDVSQVGQGNAGSQIYNAVANWAYNNHYVFVGDPKGISVAGMKRRLENMVSSALKFGTTEHLAANERMKNFIEQETGKPFDDKNLEGLLRASYDMTVLDAPFVKGIIYNPETKQFEAIKDGRRISDEDFDRLAKHAHGNADPVRAEGAPGRTTLKRGAITNSYLRERGERSELLESVRGESLQSLGLDRVLYSESRDTELPGTLLTGVNAREVVVSINRNLPAGARVNSFADFSSLPNAVKYAAQNAGVTAGDFRAVTLGKGQIYIVQDKFSTLEDFEATILHEVYGHLGMRATFGTEIYRKLNELYLAIGPDKFLQFAQKYDMDLKSYGDIIRKQAETAPAGIKMLAGGEIELRRGLLMDELLAHIAERETGKIQQKAKEILAMVKQWLRDHGFARLAGYGDAELAAVLKQGRDSLMTGIRKDGSMVAFSVKESPARSTTTGQPINQSWSNSLENTRWDDFVRTMQDKLIDTKRVIGEIKKAGIAIRDAFDPYLQEMLYHGRAAKRVADFAEKELKPLLIEMNARGVEMQELEDYLWAIHAGERNAQIAKVNSKMPDGGSGLTNAEAANILSGKVVTKNGREIKIDPSKMKRYDALAQRVKAITDATLDGLVEDGLETQETVDSWKAAYQNYVPLMRDMESDDNYAGAFNLGQGTGQGFSIRGSSAKRAFGSERGVVDILANVAMQRERAIVRAEKNRVAKAVYGLSLTAPNPDFWLTINPDANDPAYRKKLEQELIDMGLSPLDAESIAKEPKQRYTDPTTGMVVERINPAIRGRSDVLAVRVNGRDRYVMFSSDERAQQMVRNLKNLDAEQLSWAMQNVASVTRYFASINTAYNPVFGLTNGIRDLGAGALNLSSTELKNDKAAVLKNVASALRGIYIDLRAHRRGETPTSAWAQEFEEFQREGGQTGYRDMFQTSKARADALKAEIKSAGKGSAFFTMDANRQMVLAWLSDYNTAIENAVRLSAYKVAKEKGMSKQQAAAMAKNLTVNFNKKGNSATQAGALYAFFNAAVQGTARIGETMIKDGKLSAAGQKIVYGGLLLGSLQAVMAFAAGWDDEEPPQFAREKNFIIPLPGTDGKYVSIPMPLGFHVIPNLGRITTEFVLGGFKDPAKRLIQMTGLVMDAFNPLGSASTSQMLAPTIADPIISLSENKDFTGKAIYQEDFNKMKPTAGWTRSKDSASDLGRVLSYGINYISGGGKYEIGVISPTPDQIDYLFGQATGGVGREGLKLWQAGRSPFTGEELPIHKVPVAGRFIGDTTGQASEVSKFYNNLKRIGEHAGALKEMEDARDGDARLKYLGKNPDARLVPLADKANREIGYLKRQKRQALEKGDDERVKLIELQITRKVQLWNQRLSLKSPD